MKIDKKWEGFDLKEKWSGCGNNHNISVLVAGIGLFLYYYAVYGLSQQGKCSNLFLYIFSVFIFICIFIFSELILWRSMYLRNIGYKVLQSQIAGMLFICLGGVWLYKSYIIETKGAVNYPGQYLRHRMPQSLYFIFLTAAVLAMICIIYKNHLIRNMEKRFSSKGLRIIISGSIALAQAVFLYSPNFIKDTWGIYHIDAYTNSIINALRFEPYSIENISIYGHYGVFYILPVKVLCAFGLNEWEAITVSIVFFGLIAFILQNWMIHKMVQNDGIFILSSLALAVPSFQFFPGQYYQLYPHRILFPGIILAGCIFSYEHHNNKKISRLMWIVSTLAILWNFETGIVAALVWVICSLYIFTADQNKIRIRIIIFYFIKFIYIIIASYVALNIYNILLGGKIISVKSFIYPIASEKYNILILQLPLQKPFDGYFMAVFLFLGVIGLYFGKILKIELSKEELYIILTAIMGLGLYSYYMNRVVNTNGGIICFEFVCIAAYMIDGYVGRRIITAEGDGVISAAEGKIFLKVSDVYCLIFITVLTSMGLSAWASFGETLSVKLDAGYEREELYEFIDYVNDKLPKDTPGYGTGVSELYSIMNRVTGIYIGDWPDIEGFGGIVNQSAIDKLQKQIAENKYEFILVNEGHEIYLPEGYEEVDRFTYCARTFVLYHNGS